MKSFFFTTALLSLTTITQARDIRFNEDIRPILSENCFYCHGQDGENRKADLRLDTFEQATKDGIIFPGAPEKSELIARLLSHDPDEQMPPPKSQRKVTSAQIETIREWIAQGAKYEKHWAFIPPVTPEVPTVKTRDWVKSPIDTFVLQKLEQNNLTPNPEASPAKWLRRVSFDLTGLPPTLEEIVLFVNAVTTRGEAAYKTEVDRLLASPSYGERMAADWLDAARYSDSHGYNNDTSRDMYRWRDWVINAFNSNMPYAQFITEQLAGDLLPDPTLDQRIATGFNRNHGINSEGGIIDEEYRVEYVADRVKTASTVWLGLTMECSRCHDHKYDPISQKSYYEMFAFFNNVPEFGEDGRAANAVPFIPAPTTSQQAELNQLKAKITGLSERYHAQTAGQNPTTIDDSPINVLFETQDTNEEKTLKADQLSFKADTGLTLNFWIRPHKDNPADTAIISSIDYSGSEADASFGRGNELRLINGELELRISERYPAYSHNLQTVGANITPEKWNHVSVSFKKSEQRFFINGVEIGFHAKNIGMVNIFDGKDFRIGRDNARNSTPLKATLAKFQAIPRILTSEEVETTFLPFAIENNISAPLADNELWRTLAKTRETYYALKRTIPTVMIMEEMPKKRPSHILLRGVYDSLGEEVTPNVQTDLIAPWPDGAPRNRVGLAQWFTQPQHPLTSRVVVNRVWAGIFGTGIVKTLEDFGFQSEWPSHPELLDWIARDFIDGGWDMKKLYQTIVLSASYRQDSAAAPESVANDPENRLLSRGPRLRLSAEAIRDQALAISGLLKHRNGGPSVFPYQPDSLYAGIVVDAPYPGTKWYQSKGDDLYRRSLYTFLKRTAPHPSQINFDAPDRETCVVRRSRTNTPLQALSLWNEPGYLEAARTLASRTYHEAPDEISRLTKTFQRATSRPPNEIEIAQLLSSFAKLHAEFSADKKAAIDFITVGDSAVDATIPPDELAAYTAVASIILNLDETLTH
jgi:hypothetical protein